MGPLAGIRVLDLTRILAGPFAGQILADLGAEVVKVERPGTGDDTRAWGPPYLKDRNGDETRESTYFLCANRGKRSVTVNLAHEQGQALVRDLAGRADVLLENYKVGDLKRFGLDFAALSKGNSGLIYCSITGYGQDGPYAARPGYDPIAQAIGGMMSVTGERDDLPGGGPQRAGVAVIDVMTGMYAALAVTAALQHRHATGRGQHIDMALLDVQVASMINVAQAYLSAGIVPGRIGSGHPSVVPSQIFRAADGHVMLTAGNDGQFQRFCEVAACRELLGDPRFATNEARVRHRDFTVPVVAALVGTKPAAFWVEALNAVGVPCARINDMAQVFDDPQVQARGLRVELPDPVAGVLGMVASPLRFSESNVEYKLPPPRLGEHTEAVLHDWLGLEAVDVARLQACGAV
jgi:crotonobetainyl-CoA:carnitine CoA-transferase CaiB-like acyl-CoA transferase